MPPKPAIKTINGRAIPLPGDDIDTDRIIPARYLKEITFDDLGKYLFYDERFDAKGRKKKHPFNDERYSRASILLVNKNFGCGSSREHAPQSLMRYGIRAIIGESFAEIFANNSLAIGLPLVTAQKIDIENMMEVIEDDPALEIKIDMESNKASYGDFSIPVKQKDSSRIMLIEGRWDSLAELKEAKAEAKKLAERLPYLNSFKV